MKRKSVYDRVSFLDMSGKEQVRVDSGEIRPRIVSENQLRNRSDAYYFEEVVKLREDEIYVSPFDLAETDRRPEEPFKPVIRFGTPVFDRNNNKQGALLFNYMGAGLLDGVKMVGKDSAGNAMLLNSDGYWIISDKAEDEWAFLREGGKNRTFANIYPRVWRVMDSDEAGQLHTSEGLFTFASVYPLMGALGVRTGLRVFSEETPGWQGAKEYAWRLVSFVPGKTLNATSEKTSKKYLFLFAVIVIFSGLSLFIFNLRHPVHITVD